MLNLIIIQQLHKFVRNSNVHSRNRINDENNISTINVTPINHNCGYFARRKAEKPFVVGNEVICLKEIQKQITPYLKSFEEEGGVKYQYNVKSGLSYKDAVGLRLQINRVDSGLDVRVADLDYY
jgi:hypothetical protein